MPGANATHRRSKTPVYRVWGLMIQRCHNPGNPAYPSYGGRGITVCDRWRNSFEAFLADMGERPAGTSIDRIDNDGSYEPGNCRWAVPNTQARNRRKNTLLTAGGVTKTLTEWAEETGINRRTISMRIRRGWDADLALTTPVLN